MMYIIVLLLVAGLSMLILYPIFKPSRKDGVYHDGYDQKRIDLIKQKQLCYTAIKELDFDYQTGKLSEKDYHRLFNIYKTEALRIIKQIESEKIYRGRGTESKAEIHEEKMLDKGLIYSEGFKESPGVLVTIKCSKCVFIMLKERFFVPNVEKEYVLCVVTVELTIQQMQGFAGIVAG